MVAFDEVCCATCGIPVRAEAEERLLDVTLDGIPITELLCGLCVLLRDVERNSDAA